MSEQVQNNSEYLEHHPGAIEDVEKAHAMAEAGDFWETESAKYLRVAQAMLDQNLLDDESNMPLSHIDVANDERLADAVNFVRSELESAEKSEWTNIEELASEAQYVQQFAENKYSAAANAYDAVQDARRRQVEVFGEQDINRIHREYEDQVSNKAVRDVNKAHVMAKAMDRYETDNAALRHATVVAAEQNAIDPETKQVDFDNIDWTAENQAPSYYSLEAARQEIDKAADKPTIDEIKSIIEENNKDADVAAEVAADAYNLQSTKR